MNENLEEINQVFKDNGYETWNKDNYLSVLHLWEQENGEEKIRLLVKHNLVKENQILNLVFFLINNGPIGLTYEDCPLVRILEGLERDGTMIYEDSDHIHYYCYDTYIDLIKTIIKLGGEIDQNKLLEETFVGDKREYWIFNYLVDNFTFNEESVVKTAICIIESSDLLFTDEGREAFQRLSTEIGFDINTSFEDEDEDEEFLFLEVVFTKNIKLFNQFLDEKPAQNTIDQFEWDYVISESEINEAHVVVISRMLKMGYQLPLEEIVDYLKEDEYFDIAAQIEALT